MPIPDDFFELAKQVNNWGRWGPEDERGTLNLITAESVRGAAAQVRDGKRFSLAIPMSADGPQLGFVPGRSNPTRQTIAHFELYGDDERGIRFNDDAVQMGVQAATHWDALGHGSYDGRLYNGFPVEAIDAEAGAARLGADKLGAIVGRGVLLDLPRAFGVDRLEGGHALTPADLEAAEEACRVQVGEGDIVLLRTGQMQHLHAGDKMAYCISTAGPSMQTVKWFHERGAAAVATDNLSFEVYPGEDDQVMFPVHMLHLVEMGMPQGQNFDFEELAADCAADGRYAVFLSATPEPIVGATGAPVTPVAIK
ncbi:MAG TPA: cyclase family protein [Mycobacteriales bacterium]|nr:cyclase family protein [Mycobacteriales bacterium]